MPGRLYLCATPIGNLEDVTFRVVRQLKEVDVIAAEDTRHSAKLLNHYDIRTPMTSYHEHNKRQKTEYLVQRMLDGEDVALITDAGTPGVSDPGEDLARGAHEAGIQVTSLPGASACITALSASGLPTAGFVFEGFLPQDKKNRLLVIKRLTMEVRTIILYEAPHRLLRTLNVLFEGLGERRIALCRELTKQYEEVERGWLSEVIARYGTEAPRGEFVLVVEGRSTEEVKALEEAEWKDVPIDEHVGMYLREGLDRKEAMKKVAEDKGISKREVYAALLVQKE